MKHLFSASLLAISLLASASQARAEDESPFYVQLLSFMANVDENGKRAGQVPTTPYLTTASKKDAAYICKKFNRVREAIVSTAFNETITLDGTGKPDYGKMQAAMKEAITKALRKKLVSDLTLMKGAHPMGQGVASKLPYNSMGCRALTALPTLDEIRKKRMDR